MTEGLAREPDPNGGLSETPARRPISSSRLARRLPAWLNLESQGMTEDGSASVGLVFAASRQYGIMAPITEVLSKLGGLNLVSCHGISA